MSYLKARTHTETDAHKNRMCFTPRRVPVSLQVIGHFWKILYTAKDIAVIITVMIAIIIRPRPVEFTASLWLSPLGPHWSSANPQADYALEQEIMPPTLISPWSSAELSLDMRAFCLRVGHNYSTLGNKSKAITQRRGLNQRSTGDTRNNWDRDNLYHVRAKSPGLPSQHQVPVTNVLILGKEYWEMSQCPSRLHNSLWWLWSYG